VDGGAQDWLCNPHACFVIVWPLFFVDCAAGGSDCAVAKGMGDKNVRLLCPKTLGLTLLSESRMM